MYSLRHHEENASELDEVLTFPRHQRVLNEVWNDVLQKVVLTPHSIRHSIAVIPANHAAPEVGFQGVQDLHIAFVLHDGELR
jgi:hypothetical protein